MFHVHVRVEKEENREPEPINVKEEETIPAEDNTNILIGIGVLGNACILMLGPPVDMNCLCPPKNLL